MGGSFGNTLVVSGNMQTSIEHSALSDLTVNDTATVLLKSTSRGTLAGSGSVSEAVRSGVLTFAAQSSQSIVFGSRKVSDQYSVHVELPQAPSGNAYACIENKSDTGFTVAFRNSAQTLQAQTFILRWIAVEYP
jgi:hypothetical protein